MIEAALWLKAIYFDSGVVQTPEQAFAKAYDFDARRAATGLHGGLGALFDAGRCDRPLESVVPS